MVAQDKAGLTITLLRVVNGETKFTGAPTSHCQTLKDCRRFLELAYAAWRPKGFTPCEACPKLTEENGRDLSAGQLDHYKGLWRTVGFCKPKKKGGCGIGQGSATASTEDGMVFVTPSGGVVEHWDTGEPMMATEVLKQLLVGGATNDAGVVDTDFKTTMDVAFGLGKDSGGGGGGGIEGAAVAPVAKAMDSTTAALDLLAAASTGLSSSKGMAALGLPTPAAGAGAAVLPTPDWLNKLGLLTPSMASMFAAGANAKPGDISAAAADMFKLMSAGMPQAGGGGAGTIPLLAGAKPKAGKGAEGAGGLARDSAAATFANLAMLSPGLLLHAGALGGAAAGGSAAMINSPLSAAALMTPALTAAAASVAGGAMASPSFQLLLKALQPGSGETPANGAGPAPSLAQIAAALQLAKEAGGTAGTPTQQHQLPFDMLAAQQAQPLQMIAAGGTKTNLIAGTGSAVVPPPPAVPSSTRKAPAGGAGRGAGKSKEKYGDFQLDLPCVKFNQYIKDSSLSEEEIADLKKARRRKKNRLYAKRSRERKTKKLDNIDALQSKVAELEKAVSPMGLAAAAAAAATQAFGQDAAVAALAAAGLGGNTSMMDTKEESTV